MGVTELTSRWDSDTQYVLIDTHGLERTRDQKKNSCEAAGPKTAR